jgi:deoxyribodipyrimidine photo-lyase
VNLIHEPWKLNMIEQQFYDCEIGKDYPAPIVNIEETRRYASDIVWSFRKKRRSERGGERILKSMFLIRIGKQEKNKL